MNRHKIAYFCTPYVGGTWRRFTVLRPLLAQFGYDFRCIHAPLQRPAAEAPPYEGLEFWELASDVSEATAEIIRRLRAEEYSAISVPSTGNPVTGNLLRYLPKEIGSILIGVGTTRTQYRQIAFLDPYVDSVLAVSERIAGGLAGTGVPAERITTIWNGVAVPDACPPARATSPVRLLFVGRVNDREKGALYLPRVLARLRDAGVESSLEVVGDGPDADKVMKAGERFGVARSISLIGQVGEEEVARRMSEADVLLVPSRVEGFGFVAAEAMAAGCVPVVHDIPGALSSIVKDGETGFVVPIGDTATMAEKVALLARDVGLRRRMAKAGHDRARRLFSRERMAEEYATLLRQVVEEPSRRAEPLPLSDYQVPSVFRRGWWTYLPAPVRSWLRTTLNRRGVPA